MKKLLHLAIFLTFCDYGVAEAKVGDRLRARQDKRQVPATSGTSASARTAEVRTGQSPAATTSGSSCAGGRCVVRR